MLKRHAVQMGVDMTDKQREAFEAYQIKIGMATYLHYEKDKQQYGHIPMQKDWRLWQAALAHSQWISVDTALPEVETDVFVIGIRFNSWYSATAGLFDGVWKSQETEKELLFDVLYWMPFTPPITNRKD